MRRRSRGLIGLLACALAIPAIAVPALTPALQPPRLSRGQMESALDGSERFLVVYGTQDPAGSSSLRARAVALTRRYSDGDTTLAMADRDVGEDAIARHHVVLLGGPRENLWTRRFAPILPVTFDAAGFVWQGTAYRRPGDVLHLVWPQPLDPSKFMIVVAGNTVAALTRRAGRVQIGSRDWRIYRDGERVRSGEFAHRPGRPWHYDPTLDQDLEALRARFADSLPVSGSGQVRIRSAPGAGDAAPLLAAAEGMSARLARFGFGDPRAEPLVITWYASLEEKGRLTRDTRPEHLDAAGAAHVAFPAGRPRLDLQSLASARLRRLGADAGSPWLLAAGLWLSDRFEGEPLEAALSRLVRAGLLPGPQEAAAAPASSEDTDRIAAAAAWRSPLILMPARALLVRAVHETAGARGRSAVLALLAAPGPGTLEAVCARAALPVAAVRRRYRALADSLSLAGAPAARANPPRRWRPADGFQSGVCLAHEGGLEVGYLSAACGRELVRLRAAGIGWISLTPFGYLPSRDTPVIVSGRDAGPDQESDEALCEAASHARAAGLRVWLKPHLWTRGFVGDLEFGPAGWPAFFAGYREFILHYALLAEREGMDGLVIGHELTTAALGHPERWRALIAEVRRVYRGTLTYGANWGEEVRGIAFWDALDVIGVSFYTPLADTPTRDVSRLEAGARRALADLRTVARRAGRPVLILEAGYAPHAGTAVKPWEDRGGARDLEAQRACYEALVRALGPETWVAGVHWWKWFSDAAMGGPGDASHTPRGKPAEMEMRRAFTAWQGRPVTPPRPRPTDLARPEPR